MKIAVKKQQGFTLVELITVMVISGIVAMLVVNLIASPMTAYADLKRRAELVDIAELTLHRMARDIHHALPNSVRISADQLSLEILHTIDGGRYASSGADAFTTTASSTSFGLLRPLRISAAQAVGLNVVVYNLGENGADAYQTAPLENRSEITALTDSLISYNAIQFPLSSPQARYMIVDKPILFGCLLANNSLYLKQDYAITASMGSVSSSDALLAKKHY